MESAEATQTPQVNSPDRPLWHVLLKAVGLTLAVVVVFFIITGLIIGLVSYRFMNSVAKAGNTTVPSLIQLGQTAWETTPSQSEEGYKRILILGTDQLANRGQAPVLTDTIMLASIDLTSGSINLLSLPRDLWHEAYQTRINALYYYGQERYPERPEQFPEEVISELTGVTFDHTLVIKLDQLSTLIDMVGGIEVSIEEGFTDTEFPRSDVDVTTETDPALLYETVTFEAGTELMDGERALKYIRSRKSQGDQGTDDARALRQQHVIEALMTKMMQPAAITNPTTLGSLYAFYQNNFAQAWPITDLAATAKSLYPVRSNISITPHALVITNQDTEGVIYHPPTALYDGQWIYAVQDEDAFMTAVQTALFK